MLDLNRLTDALVSSTKQAIASEVTPLLARIASLEKAIAERPAPADGKDADPEAVADLVTGRIKSDLDAMREAIPAAPEVPDFAKMIADAVSAAVAAIPAPKDGKDGERGPQGEKGGDGHDGVGLAGALIERSGELAMTLTNGVVQKLGLVVGKDGDNGKDGVSGRDGADGLGFEHMILEHDEHGRAVAKFVRGDVVKSIVLPGIVDRGPFRAGEEYQKGDAVSYGGSLWIAQDKTADRPDGGSGWRLAVKRGRDGKDGEVKALPEQKPVKVT